MFDKQRLIRRAALAAFVVLFTAVVSYGGWRYFEAHHQIERQTRLLEEEVAVADLQSGVDDLWASSYEAALGDPSRSHAMMQAGKAEIEDALGRLVEHKLLVKNHVKEFRTLSSEVVQAAQEAQAAAAEFHAAGGTLRDQHSRRRRELNGAIHRVQALRQAVDMKHEHLHNSLAREIATVQRDAYLSRVASGCCLLGGLVLLGCVVAYTVVRNRRLAQTIRALDESRQRLKEKDKQIRQQQKMEAVGSLAGGVAHEFNNLLQAIDGLVSFAMDDVEQDRPAYDDLAEARTATKRAAGITRQLLDYSRTETVRHEAFFVNESIASVKKMLRPLLEANIELNVEVDENIGPVNGDSALLTQAIMNLCVNARDAMPDGGRLTLRSQDFFVDEDMAEMASGLEVGRHVRIMVTDTGCGIPEEMKDRVFEPFFTTKTVGDGTGLGLSMVYGTVQQHQGRITVYSEPGRGTTFKIYLPVSEADTMETPQTNPANSDQGAGRLILVAEDEEMVRKVSIRILERAGYRTLAAEDGQQAVELFDQHRHEIDLLLFDVMMPRLTGRQAYLQIREERPEVPAVFCTGYDPEAGQAQSLHAEGHVIIEKPFNQETLLSAVKSALEAADSQPDDELMALTS